MATNKNIVFTELPVIATEKKCDLYTRDGMYTRILFPFVIHSLFAVV